MQSSTQHHTASKQESKASEIYITNLSSNAMVLEDEEEEEEEEEVIDGTIIEEDTNANHHSNADQHQSTMSNLPQKRYVCTC